MPKRANLVAYVRHAIEKRVVCGVMMHTCSHAISVRMSIDRSNGIVIVFGNACSGSMSVGLIDGVTTVGLLLENIKYMKANSGLAQLLRKF